MHDLHILHPTVIDMLQDLYNLQPPFLTTGTCLEWSTWSWTVSGPWYVAMDPDRWRTAKKKITIFYRLGS